MKKVAILGSTGSIGKQALEVISAFPESFKVVALAAGRNFELLAQQAQIFRPSVIALMERKGERLLKERLKSFPVSILSGLEGLKAIASCAEADLVLTAISGTMGLIPLLEAIKAKKNIALANKEPLVVAGEIIIAEAKKNGIKIIPVDSEHSALFQILEGKDRKTVEKIILTASGGPFADFSPGELEKVTPQEALSHPVWKMGKKVTIDSATLMNKGLEVLEAHWLFGIDVSKIEVLIHPQSLIHSLVEFIDGSLIAQMSIPDMRLPILYALSYPNRMKNNLPKIEFNQLKTLTFKKPNREAFPCLEYAYRAAEIGGTMPAVLCAADEVAVEKFLEGTIKFTEIPKVIKEAMDNHKSQKVTELKQILQAEKWAKEQAAEAVRKLPRRSNVQLTQNLP